MIKVILPLKRFLLIERCPPEWKGLDLYLFRDEQTAFYAGQSQQAFGRVWEHLLGGFKGHSMVGRFVWCNWPASMNFTIEMMSSQDAAFDDLGNDLNAAERRLIQEWRPCFNVSLNEQPRAVPEGYLAANAKMRRLRSLNALIHDAERAVRVEETRRLLEEAGE